MTDVFIASAAVSNYEGMDALVGQDGRVYLGRQENYFPSVEDGVPSYYDNSDNSLQLVSDNAKIFHLLYGEGWPLSQRQLRRERCFTKADYIEFASLRDGLGMTILMATHDMDVVPLCCDYAYLLGGGSVLARGTPEELFAQAELLRANHLRLPRIAHLMANRRADPRRILTLTFNKESAREMGERWQRLFGGVFPRDPVFSTIHSFCLGLLRDHAAGRGTQVPELLEGKGAGLKDRLLRELYQQDTGKYLADEDLSNAVNAIGYCVNMRLTGEQAASFDQEVPGFSRLFSRYTGYKRENGLMDFDDMLLFAATALDRNANPMYNRTVASVLAGMGAFVGALTPEQLGNYIGAIMQ